jgi:hypothetical protein
MELRFLWVGYGSKGIPSRNTVGSSGIFERGLSGMSKPDCLHGWSGVMKPDALYEWSGTLKPDSSHDYLLDWSGTLIPDSAHDWSRT